MDGRENNEMEQIQQGLEAFLRNELEPGEEGNRASAAEQFRSGSKRGSGRDTAGGAGTYYGRKNYADRNSRENFYKRTGLYDTEDNFEEGYTGEEYYEEDKEYDEEDSEVEVVDWDLSRRSASGRHSSGRQTSGRPASERQAAGRQSEGRSVSGARNTASGGTAGRKAPGNRSAGSRSGNERTSGSSGRGRSGNGRISGSTTEEQVSGGFSRGRASGKGVSNEQTGRGKASGKKSGKKKGSRLKAKLCKILIVLVVIAALLGFGLYQLVGVAYSKMNYREIASMTGKPMQEDGVVNILLIGNDSRENGEDGRSDAMILLSISSKTKSIYMTSLLRDIYVDIPGYDGNRLNAAYSYGGAELLMETIEKNFDISVNRYVLVNFEAFASLVDAVDGIDLELTSEEIEYVNGYLVEYNILTGRPQGTDDMDTSVSGLVHLNGPQALAYSRNRYLGTDFGRTERQRKVLTAVIGKLPKALLTNAGGLMDGLMPNLTTNLTQGECMRLCLMGGKLLSYDIVSDNIPQPGTYNNATIRGMSVLEVDFETNIRYLKEKIYGE